MQDEASSACGHENSPSARFCDVCGARLPLQCPRCSAINRRHANFCANCGVDLRDVGRTHATPPVASGEPLADTAPANEAVPAIVESEFMSTAPVVSPTRAARAGADVGDAERLEHIRRFFDREK